jgi:hypothetical protein
MSASSRLRPHFLLYSSKFDFEECSDFDLLRQPLKYVPTFVQRLSQLYSQEPHVILAAWLYSGAPLRLESFALDERSYKVKSQDRTAQVLAACICTTSCEWSYLEGMRIVSRI